MNSASDNALLEQGSPEWLEARLGKVTASRIADVIAVTKNGPSEKRNSYMMQLVSERLTGDFTRSYTSDAMLHGIEYEPVAREFYESLFDVSVEQVGLIDHPTIEMSAASPDGLVGTDGLIEIKCMTSVNHFKALHDNKPPAQYLPQVHWQMACTGAGWCDLTLFDPRVPLELQLKVFRIERDEAEITRLEEAVILFNRDVEDAIAKIWSNKQ